jgi:hypothetical protein
MTHFSKKHSVSNFDNSYQITATGSHEGRKAVITKFANEKTWSVAKWFSNHLGKADDIQEGFKTLSHAKESAEFFVTA